MSPIPGPAALVGVAVDVSGSMKSSIRNRQGKSQSRFESFREALGRVLEKSRGKAEEWARIGAPPGAECLVFAYAFGLSASPNVVDLLALVTAAQGVTNPAEIEALKTRYENEIRQRYSGYSGLAGLARASGFGGLVDQVTAGAPASAESEVRAKIMGELADRVRSRLAAQREVTLTLTDLAKRWSGAPGSFEHAEAFIYGGTPMRQCLEQVADRFTSESQKLDKDIPKLLVLVSDGDPTDGDPRAALDRIRAQGVFVVSCLVTDADVTEPYHLYAEARPEWTPAAKLMFDAASAIADDDAYRELLEGRGWTVAEHARVFTQVNQSEMMDEFLTLAFSRADRG